MKIYPACKPVECDLFALRPVYLRACTLKDGVLAPGFVQYNTYKKFTDKIVRVEPSASANGILYGCSNSKIYRSTFLIGDDMKLLYEGSYPRCTAHYYSEPDKAAVVLYADKHYCICDGGMFSHGEMPIMLQCSTYHKGRVFGIGLTDDTRLYWTGPDSYADWTVGENGAGRLNLDAAIGSVKRIYSIGDELILLSKSGILRVQAGGNPENFKQILPVMPIEDFLETSVRKIGDAIYFMTADFRFFRYRGGQIKELKDFCAEDVSSVQSAGDYNNRYYMLCGNSKHLNRDVLYIYDVLDNTWQVLDFAAYITTYDYYSAMCFTKDYIYRLRASTSVYMYCGEVDFGSQKRKYLREIEAEGTNYLYVTIDNGRGSRSFSVKNGRVRVNMTGRKFNITVSGSGTFKKCKLYAEEIG